ncbi:hypothetical protein PAXINDRAFT_14768 [Paxillus involutus ATCC 200175]|uniref:Uncharacterized protein n=1 Tax=Paxillus involutus ATCC 200175 TaxID=664439 RepID=A0A0C9SU03_PAXIN|nr:hypothetical protein PAXINDRAFT_14768 [Paxillus involutus ATCC 200175]
MSENIAQAIPSWPSQLCKDINKSMIDTRCSPIFDELNFDKFVEVIHNNWQGIIHPLGPMYYFNAKLNAYTRFNVVQLSHKRLQKFEMWLQGLRSLLPVNGAELILVAEPFTRAGSERYQYYVCDLESCMIMWLQKVDATFLLAECGMIAGWNHKRHTLTAQFWRHVETFPHHICIPAGEVQHLQCLLTSLCVESSFVMESTASFIFGSRESLVEMTNILKDVECFVTDSQSRFLMEPAVFSYDHNQFLHYYGQPEACLVRSYSVLPHQYPKPYGIFWLISVAALLGFPIFEFGHLNCVCVDGIVSPIDIAAYIDKTNSNVKFQMGLATVVLAVDSGILGIVATNFQSIPLTMCHGSFIACITCIIAGLITGHLGERLKSPLMFTAGTLNNHICLYTAAFSMPTSLCIMGLGLSLIAFFLSGGDPLTSPWASLIICSSIAVLSVLEIAVLLMIYSGRLAESPHRNSFGAV